MNKRKTAGAFIFSPLMIIGAVLILLPIFVFVVLQSINRQTAFGERLLLEKGAALIRAFEAGARAGMMGRSWGNRRLQELLRETARQPDIAYLLLIDDQNRILAHNDSSRIGSRHQPELDAKAIARQAEPQWRFVNAAGNRVFEVYKAYRPSQKIGHMPFDGAMRRRHQKMHRRMERFLDEDESAGPDLRWKPGSPRGEHPFFQRYGFLPPEHQDRQPFEPIIVLGFDTESLDAARADDRNRAIISGVILFLVSTFGIVLLFLFYNYRTTRSSLSQIRAFSDSLLDHMPIGLVAFNEYLEISSINAFAESLLEVDAGTAMGNSAEQVLPRSLWNAVQWRISQQGPASGEISCRLPSGKVLPLEIALSYFTGESQDIAGTILLLKDLSQVKALEREIELSRRMAAIGRLAAGVAHEIRNPLSSIKGFATYFKERYPDAPQDQKIARIMIDETERLNRVVSQLLELARPVQINAAPVELDHLLTDSLRLVEHSAQEAGVEISRPEGAAGVFRLDHDRIRQVLLNLYLNALDAMPDGGRLSVGLDLREKERLLQITVSDTGVGIEAEDLSRIHDPYFTTKQSGTGLGLAVVHNIIEAHGGSLTVESQAGKGSIFTLTLPEYTGDNNDES